MRPASAVRAAWALAVLCGCGAQSGVDEHGNAFSARVRVVDSSGTPQAGRAVFLLPSGWVPGDPLDTLSQGRQGGRGWTDSVGWAEVDGLRGSPVAAFAGDSAFAGLEVFAPGSAEPVLQLRRVGAVAGSAVGARSGTPVRLAGTELGATVDSSGSFVLASLPPGELTLVLVGRSGARTVLRSVRVESGRLTRLAPFAYDSSTVAESAPGQSITDEVPPPLVEPPGGSFAGPVVVRARSVFPSDSLVVSRDGAQWEPWTGMVLESDACLLFKSLRPGTRSVPVRTECYTVAPR